MPDHRPLRLLVVGLRWPPETFLLRLLDGLLARGIEVTVATSTAPGSDWLEREGFHWLGIPAWGGPGLRRFGRLFGLARAGMRSGAPRRWLGAHAARAGGPSRAARACNRLLPFLRESWDVIYFPWNSAAVDHAALYGLGAPVVVSCRGSQVNIAPHDPQRRQLRDGLPTSFTKAAVVHCVSWAILREAMAWGLDPGKAVIIPPAVDPAVFAPGQPPAGRDRFVVVTTGSLVWNKGHEYALEAIRRLVKSGIDVRLDVIGEGPERARVHYTIHDMGLQERVRLLGQLAPDQVGMRLRDADAFLLSSLSEGISNAVLEAMACGLPVVTTDCGGMREAVTHGVEGFVVPVRDSSAIADVLGQLARDPALRRRMGAAGRQRVLREFTLEGQVAQFAEVFRRVGQLDPGTLARMSNTHAGGDVR